jgi:hypothetical protein
MGSLLSVAAGIATLAAVLGSGLLRWRSPGAADVGPRAAVRAASAPPPAPVETLQTGAGPVRRRVPPGIEVRPAAPGADKPRRPEVINRLYEVTPPEERTGIAVFPPPGTDPPKRGIVVPDDFALPAGYVRHHQTDDSGNRLPPILMFHPDYEWVDASGARVAVPADRIVPPEMAPPGLAVRMLELPEPGPRTP